MPIEFAAYTVLKSSWLNALTSYKSAIITCLSLLVFTLYRFCQGRSNMHEADMHGKVILITGGTSGIGAAVTEDLAARGAQLILLVRSVADGWTQDYITELRARTENELIYAEECDLEDLYSVRKFATKWIDNAPPRRLDQVILCAGVALPIYTPRRTTRDGVEVQLGVNYLANYHLLTILSPAIRAQPADREVRIIGTTCPSHLLASVELADMEFLGRGYPADRPWQVFGASKVFFMSLLHSFGEQVRASKRPDGQPSRVRTLVVDPGFSRTLSLRRFVSFGSLLGLAAYCLTYPFWFTFFKSARGGAQSVLYVSMAPAIELPPTTDAEDEGGTAWMIAECMVKPMRRPEMADRKFRADLLAQTETLVKELELRSALARKQEEKTTTTTKATTKG